MLTRSLMLVVVVWSVSGCANLLSIHRQDDITPAVGVPGARVVFVDAKQRAVTALARPSSSKDGRPSTTSRTVVCAEPSPDALQAIAASNAFSIRDERDREAKLAQVLQESAASIGLRTQSIQLLRDAMYRICEAYQAHALDDDEVMSLHRRYQNLMLGLLAIEQLTGATKAGQIALINAGSASVGAATADLAAAEKRVADERKALADADERVAVKSADSATAAAKVAQKTADVQKETDASKKASLQAELEALVQEKSAKDAAAANATMQRNIQADLVKAAMESANSARGRASATAEGNAKLFDGLTVRGSLDSQSTTAIATAAHTIVKEVVNSSFLYEACFSHLDRLVKEKNPSAIQQAVLLDLLDVCFAGVRSAASRLQSSTPASGQQGDRQSAASGGAGGNADTEQTAPTKAVPAQNSSSSQGLSSSRTQRALENQIKKE